MSASLDRVLARLDGVRPSGSGFVARCPAHEDRNPSLSIHERGGKILLNCFAGCTSEAVRAALGIELNDLFGDPTTPSRIVAEYNYHDENGKLLFQVVRLEPKGFRQRRPDGKDGWTWKLDGVRRVPYRLPEVTEVSSSFICEGEKDCESARALGFVATCSPGGAGKWREEYSEHFYGKQITIIADADEPGRKHAGKIAESLHGKAVSVKMLEMPGAKDFSEWVERGGTREAFEKLIAETPEWKPQAENAAYATGFRLVRLGELLDKPQIATQWVWRERLAVGTVSLVVAKPKVGKSTLARNLALAVSRGETFLGFATRKGKVVYLALEERSEDIAADFRALGATPDDEILVHADSVPADGMFAAIDLVRQSKPVLLVVDPLFRLARIRDEKAYAETYAALGPLIGLNSSNSFSGFRGNLGSIVSHSIVSFLSDVNRPITRIALAHPSFTRTTRNNSVQSPFLAVKKTLALKWSPDVGIRAGMDSVFP